VRIPHRTDAQRARQQFRGRRRRLVGSSNSCRWNRHRRCLGLYVLLQRTTVGLQIRAYAEDSMSAGMMVCAPSASERRVTYQGVIAGSSRCSGSPEDRTVQPSGDLNPTLRRSSRFVIGGLGSVRGAVVGGLALASSRAFCRLPGRQVFFRTARRSRSWLVILVISRGRRGCRQSRGALAMIKFRFIVIESPAGCNDGCGGGFDDPDSSRRVLGCAVPRALREREQLRAHHRLRINAVLVVGPAGLGGNTGIMSSGTWPSSRSAHTRPDTRDAGRAQT